LRRGTPERSWHQDKGSKNPDFIVIKTANQWHGISFFFWGLLLPEIIGVTCFGSVENVQFFSKKSLTAISPFAIVITHTVKHTLHK